ncbi:MAG: alpha/beta hydrolase [Acidobacteriales bacterium]|nr:alpha/beta hydrolase [Terriglobales bacterium]
MAMARRQRVPAGCDERFVELEGRRMRYLVAGDGPALLLLHGSLGFSFSFSENIAELGRHFRVYAPDNINLGYSDRAVVDASVAATARRALGFMDAVGMRYAVVLGTSLGGPVALEMARMAPERIRKLILVSAANPWSERWRWQIALFSTPVLGWIAAKLMYWLPLKFYDYAIRSRMYADKSRALPGTVEEYVAAMKVPGTFEHGWRMVQGWDRDFASMEDSLREPFPMPVTLLWGSKDKIVPVETGRTLREHIPGCVWIEMPESGHLPYEEQPDEFNRILIEVLSTRKEKIA